jgi:2,3-diaminopropionate biosynthesis protein SbnA
VPILANPLDLIFSNLFIEIHGLIENGRLIVKLEGYNVTGSIKIKSALFMIADLEQRGLLTSHRSTVIESSSGNLGIALALICNRRGYPFICVTDPNISATNLRGIEAYGGQVVVVEERDPQGGFLETRLAYIRNLLAKNANYVWLNQYANDANVRAHADWTALEILGECPNVTHVYAGSGTTGTVMGLAKRFSEMSPSTIVVAVEPEGSVTFDATRSGRRLIPGIGTSRRPELADTMPLDHVVYVSEMDAVRMCHHLAHKHGLLLGGSSGSVLAAVMADSKKFSKDSTVVAISPDLGDRYLDSIFSADWCFKSYGLTQSALHSSAPSALGEPITDVISRRGAKCYPLTK